MVEKENAQSEDILIQVDPPDNVSTNDQPSVRALVQSLVTDQSILTAISQAVLSAIQPSLQTHVVDQTTNDTRVAAPVGQSTSQNPTGVSVDQTVCQTNKRKITETVDLSMGEGSSKRLRLKSQDGNTEHINDAFLDADQVELEDIPATSSRWEASEELDALLGIMFKPLPRFDRRAITREFPRPVSDAAWTPSLDNYLPPMISGAKASDTPLRDIQDKVLDTLGPLCTLYENTAIMHESLSEDKITLESATVSAIMNCVKKAILLVGDTSAQLSAKRREQVLAKLNPYLVSLGKEDFPGAGRDLFGEGFESRLKLRTETANTVAQAKKAGAPFFRGTAPRRFQGRFRGGRAQSRPSFFNPMRGSQTSFRGRGRVPRFNSPRQFLPRQ